MSMVKEQKREASTSKMLDAALSEFALNGYAGARIERMAESAGVSKGLFSQRFHSKELLYSEVYDRVFDDLHLAHNNDDDILTLLNDIIDLIKRTAKNDPTAFAYIARFFHDNDIPKGAKRAFHEWYLSSHLDRMISDKMEQNIIPKAEPFEGFCSFLRISCGITKNFADGGLKLPENKSYLALMGYRMTADGEETREVQLISADEERRVRDTINVLSSEYNAVYYCNAKNHTYEILYQQGFVREELLKMLQMLPRFEDAFNYYVETLVHPNDRLMMRKELNTVTTTLSKRKGFKTEFRRSYGGKWLYTEMNCVKIGEAEDELHYFVVGFSENDEEYRNLMDQQKQLEYIVTERTAELQARNKSLNKINEEIIELFGTITEARDTESGEHIRRVKGFTNILATQMMNDWPEYGLTNDMIELMTSASALHDVGKIMIPDAILLKPGRLTKEEFEIMKTHCDKGVEILRHAPEEWSDSYLRVSMDIARGHHEKWDGSGYPQGLSGDQIPLAAQIVSVADCFDALTTERVYKKAYETDVAFQMILDGECGVFSEKLLTSFKNCRNKLFRHVAEVREEFTSALPAGLSTASLSWTKILFVDDNDMSREMGVDILTGEGAEVTPVSSGKEAIETFKNAPAGTFDVILMDVIMPEMDGMEATAAIRKLDHPDAKNVSIIALTSLTTEEDIRHCLDAGMDSFITKPIAISSLNRVLYECLQAHNEALGQSVVRNDKESLERLEHAMKNSNIFSGITADYELVFYVNGNTNDVPAYRASDMFQALIDGISMRLPSNRRLDQLFKSIIPPKEFQNFLDDANRVRIIEYLENHDSYHIFFPTVINGVETLYRMRVVKDPDYPSCFIFGLQSVDAETTEGLRTSELVEKLIEAYVLVDYVDLDTDTIIRYKGDGLAAFSDTDGMTFSEIVANYAKNNVFEDDRPLFYDRLNPVSLKKELKNHQRVGFRYRDISGRRPHYYEIQLVNAGEEKETRYVIMTIADVDEYMRREKESETVLAKTKEQLAEAERRANRDALTGVKNITAYTDSIANLSEELKNNSKMEFAVVMFDVNNLKYVNDNFGHDTGDTYIRNCCSIICNVFKHSPIYRIGGDEFVAILKGNDYRERDNLMNNFREIITKANALKDYRGGKAFVAAGLATYDDKYDASVAEVIKRADAEMYTAKRLMKAGRTE